MTTHTTTAPHDEHTRGHEGLTVPELLDVLDGRPLAPPPERPPAVVSGAREVASAVRRAAPPAAAAVSAAATTAGTVTVQGVRRAWRTYEAWPRRVEPGRRPGTGPGRLR